MATADIEKIVSLCKRRGFVFPGSEIYGGLANSWDYGPLGVELKNNIKRLWWNRFVTKRDDIVGLESAVIMNPKVWEKSGHTGTGFADPLIECKKCHERYREDQLPEKKCLACGSKEFTEPKMFNILMKTFLGAVEGEKSVAYLRGETAQGMFVDFKQVLDTSRQTVPFGIAQIGKAFRNEITPGNFIFRTREFEQMEIEYFIPVPQSDKDWQKAFELWQKQMHDWISLMGIDLKKVHDTDIPDKERAHYSKRTIDFMYEFPFGEKELYGLAYRTDFDLKNHYPEPPYRDAETGELYYPHVIEPTWGVDRTVLAVLCEAYAEEGDRTILKLKPYLAPYQVAVFPLVANKPELVNKAREVFEILKTNHQLPITSFWSIAWDDRGNIGKRYYSQDEIGTPYCLTIDYQTLEDNTVTVRDRDTTKQDRIEISNLVKIISDKISLPE
jgi:glycyl-tRNA synthetase